MKVWFVSHYSMPPQYEMRIKTQMYSHFLNSKGHKTVIFAASTIHNTDINLIEDGSKYIERSYDDLEFVHIKCDNYKGNGIKRILNMWQFACRFGKIANRFERPDVIVADVNCINYAPVYRFCKKYNIPFYVDVRDLWPESIVEYYGFKKSNLLIKYLYHREKTMYHQATGIIFSMEGGIEYIREKGWLKEQGGPIDESKIYNINNGINIDEYLKQKMEFAFADVDLDNSNTFKVMYTGSIRKVNDIGMLVETAKKLKDNCDIMFIIYGDGDERAALEKICSKENLKNVVFKGSVDKKYIPYILSKSNLNLIHVKSTPLMRFGCSLNKLFDYLASGKPILSDLPVNYDLIKRYNAGITIDEQNAELLANEILRFYNMPKEDYNQIGENAFAAAKDYDYEKLTERLFEIIS